MNNLPIISGVEIATDDQGRFNLNALHKASGGADSKRPKNWLETKTAKNLVNELRQNSALGQNVIDVKKGGATPGTFAHELLAISYAGWISPSFQLQVNQTFIDYKTGKLSQPAIPNFDNPAEAARAWADQYEQTKAAKEKLELADQEVQRLQCVCHDIAAQFAPGMTPACFCRQLNGVNTQQVQAHLVKRGMLYRQKRNYRAVAYYRDNWFTERHENPLEGVTTTKVLLTRKGAINLYKLYLKGDLPMKASWDKKHSHCLFDQSEPKAMS